MAKARYRPLKAFGLTNEDTKEKQVEDSATYWHVEQTPLTAQKTVEEVGVGTYIINCRPLD